MTGFDEFTLVNAKEFVVELWDVVRFRCRGPSVKKLLRNAQTSGMQWVNAAKSLLTFGYSSVVIFDGTNWEQIASSELTAGCGFDFADG
jgi:hypothetical protein